MVKTIAKPIYNWMISTDNDPVMEKFTNRMLPETQFRGHHDEHKISSHAQQGDEVAMWQAISKKYPSGTQNKILERTTMTFTFNVERMSN